MTAAPIFTPELRNLYAAHRDVAGAQLRLASSEGRRAAAALAAHRAGVSVRRIAAVLDTSPGSVQRMLAAAVRAEILAADPHSRKVKP